MKKTLLTICAVIAIAGCSKTEVVYTDSQEISVMPVPAITPKGGPIDGTVYPTDGIFKVISFYGSTVEPSTAWSADKAVSPYFTWTNFKQINGNWAAHSDDTNTHTPKYWPKTGSLYFAAYSPYDITLTKADYDFAKAALSLEGYTQKAFTLEAGSTKSTSMDDLLWFDVDDQSSANAGPLAVKFKHALSWITIKVQTDEASKNLFTVKSIALKQVNTKGDFLSKNTDETPKAVWTNQSTATDYMLYNDAAGHQINETAATEIADGLIVVPQNILDANILEVTYNQDGFNDADGTTPTLFKKEIKLNNGVTENNAWEINKHYTYTLIFGASEILLAPTVGEWDNGTTTDINVQ